MKHAQTVRSTKPFRAERRQQGDAYDETLFFESCERAPVGMAHVGVQGDWRWANARLCELLGYSRDELRRLTARDLTYPEDQAASDALITDMLSSRRERASIEKRYVRKDGQIVWALLNASLARDTSGEPDHFISVIEDISERRERDEARTRALGVVTHELNTPLTSLSLRVRLLRNRLTNGTPVTDADLAQIAFDTTRLTRIANDLTVASRLEHGDELVLESAPVILGVVCAREVETQRLISGRLIALFLPNEPVIAVGDEQRIAQALANLLSNASKYSPEDAPVTLTLERLENEALITVANEGPGIEPTMQERLFEPYFRAPQTVGAAAPTGLGLGLHITQLLIERQGGSIGVESEPGEGARMWLRLPLADVASTR